MKAFFSCVAILAFLLRVLPAQVPPSFQWNADGYKNVIGGEIVEVTLPGFENKTLASQVDLTPKGSNQPLVVESYSTSSEGSKILIYTNAKRVWRYKTRGDYWLLNLQDKSLRKVGKEQPESSLMFAKFSPDGQNIAYVSKHNIYVENVASGETTQLTTDGTDRLINGTFDWVYEEELYCYDGFRWSPNSRTIAYWQLDATKIRNFLMINNTDSIYSFTVPVEYPKVGQTPSPYRIGVVEIDSAGTKWMNIPGNPQETYLPAMEWTAGESAQLVMQQLNRKQNESNILLVNPTTGEATSIFNEKDEAWIDNRNSWSEKGLGWDWINGGKEFVWLSEMDGWRHAYRLGIDGKSKALITNGNFDVIETVKIDEASNAYYFLASPNNATQTHLYKANLDGSGEPVKVSPDNQLGTHQYNIGPGSKFARHTFSSAKQPPIMEWVALADQKILTNPDQPAQTTLIDSKPQNIEFFKVTTSDSIEIDAWMVKPDNFDSTKKYPILFKVYGEPAGSTVKDSYGTSMNSLYIGDMAKDGYIYVSIDNRGTPSPKGRAWRKAIYRKIGRINIRDQAEAAQAMFKKFPFIDTSRVAVHGWSGGGSSTLNLLFQYPDIFKTGIAGAAISYQPTYDNIYQERYMGLPQENLDDFVKGSPVTHAKFFKGNLLYIHGTGDDNVHYQNAEILLNELIKYNKQFQFMPYPNRTHGVTEGEGTTLHLATLFTKFLKEHCPPGPRD